MLERSDNRRNEHASPLIYGQPRWGRVIYLCHNRTHVRRMNMTDNQVHVTLRLPPSMLEQVEAHRQKLEATMKQRQTRADALRSLIAHGLEAVKD